MAYSREEIRSISCGKRWGNIHSLNQKCRMSCLRLMGTPSRLMGILRPRFDETNPRFRRKKFLLSLYAGHICSNHSSLISVCQNSIKSVSSARSGWASDVHPQSPLVGCSWIASLTGLAERPFWIAPPTKMWCSWRTLKMRRVMSLAAGFDRHVCYNLQNHTLMIWALLFGGLCGFWNLG